MNAAPGQHAQAPTRLWDAIAETRPRSELLDLQSERLSRQVHYVFRNSSFFRDLYDSAGVSPRDIDSIDDIGKLPTFSKEDLRSYRDKTKDPFGGTLCVPLDQLAFVTHSSGTSGRPNLYGLTPDEHEQVGSIFARSSYTAGIRPGDHLVMPGGLRWHGTILGWDKAFEQMGVVKHYFGNSVQDIVEHTIEMGSDLQYLNVFFVYQPETELEYFRKSGIDPKQLYPNRKMLWSAVDASPARRKLFTEVWGVPLKNQYGSGDQFWMTGECPHDYRYSHAPDDYFIFEVLDPNTAQPVPSGGTGLLHVTNLWCRSCPYIRYNMEDMVAMTTEPCTCGRTSTRLHVRGRLAWSVRIGDRYVFTQEVEDVLWARPDMAASNYQLVRRHRQPQDRLIVRVVPNEDARTASLEQELQEELTRHFGVPAEVRLGASADITTKGIKMQRVLDED